MSDRSIEAVVERSLGIYGTAPTCYLSCLARSPEFARADWDRAIGEDRSLVRVRAMRYSVYTFTHALLPVAIAATRGDAFRAMERQSRQIGDSYERLAREVEGVLADGALPSADIRRHVDPGRELGPWFSSVLGRMSAECRIVRAANTGGWRSNRLTYALWAQWVPDVDPFEVEEAEARRRLAERYVAAYGPVELDDLRWWAGWRKGDTVAAAEGLDLDAAGSAAGLLDGVRLLPVWDVLMVAYRNRERLFDPAHAPFLYDKMGNATSVVLDAGRIAGVWDLGRADDPLTIRVAPLGRWPKRRWADVEAQADRIGGLVGASEVEVERREAPVNLQEAPRNRFLSPLAD